MAELRPKLGHRWNTYLLPRICAPALTVQKSGTKSGLESKRNTSSRCKIGAKQRKRRRRKGRAPREAHDNHPKDKLDVGKRMARWALVTAYHYKMPASGPVFRNAKLRGSKLVVTFDDVGKGLRIRNGGKLEEFAVAGADHQWHWASAKSEGRNRVAVWSDAVPRPVAVRYAFNSNPRNPNLTDDTGLPAAPFRSDS